MYTPPTIKEQIEGSKNLDISHRSLNSHIYIENSMNNEVLKIPFNALYSKFKDYFDTVTAVIPLTEEQQVLYRFSPKKLSLKLYQTVEYWSLLLYLNECPSIIDFDLTKVRIVYNDKIKSFLNELFILEKR